MGHCGWQGRGERHELEAELEKTERAALRLRDELLAFEAQRTAPGPGAACAAAAPAARRPPRPPLTPFNRGGRALQGG